MKPSKRGRASERIAKSILESLGFKVKGEKVKVKVDNIEVSEADLLVEDKKGQEYVVEVKSGLLDVSGIRQVYTNSVLLRCKPMVVCKGFSDDSARALARKLKVKVVTLEDKYLMEPEELEVTIRESLLGIIGEVLKYVVKMRRANTKGLIEALANSSNIVELSKMLNVDIKTAYEMLKDILGEKPRPGMFTTYRIAAQILLILR